MNQFGATLGGPLMVPRLYNTGRHKTFFFVDYEGIRRSQGQSTTSTVPLESFVQGDFAAGPFRIHDPLTTRANPAGAGFIRDPFPLNRIPADRIDRVGRNIANLYPRPNLSGLANNFVFAPTRTLRINNVDAKIDY